MGKGNKSDFTEFTKKCRKLFMKLFRLWSRDADINVIHMVYLSASTMHHR